MGGLNFYFKLTEKNKQFESKLKNILENKLSEGNAYILDRLLLLDSEPYENLIMVLVPNHKIIIIKTGDKFEDDFENLIEDVGKLSWQYGFEKIIGRTREWYKEDFIKVYKDINDLVLERLNANEDKRRVNILISIIIGSINEAERIKSLDIDENLVERIKRRIVLLDTDQLNFIYEEKGQKRVVIQGLSGTGKTELLFHKIKNYYIKPEKYRIMLTCHNRVLANTLRKRIEEFFNLMKVSKQINPDYLKIFHAWGSKYDENSGAYRYITHFYGITFYSFGQLDFDNACKSAIEEIKRIKERDKENFEYAFDYTFIDEAQDFPDSFIELCELVTKEKVYVAGDLFQDIFEYNKNREIKADIILNKCYRTDNINLMFSHALGMGLFEKPHLNWLDDEDWRKIGYKIQEEGNEVKLTREPLNRFLEIEEKIDSIFVYDEANLIDKTLEVLRELKEKYEVNSDDIAIIFIDDDKYIYDAMYYLASRIYEELGFDSNRVVETKEKIDDKVFITNRNNVKGLEFPFVICLTKRIKNDLPYRNSLYAMLSRSFITSYLIVESKIDENIKEGLKTIKETGFIETYKPDEIELEQIRNRIISYKKSGKAKTLDEFIDEKLDKNGITDAKYREVIKEIVKSSIQKLGLSLDNEKIIEKTVSELIEGYKKVIETSKNV